jgi:FKBP-type peptidyl-prolyl cis-trans isomerase SlyD
MNKVVSFHYRLCQVDDSGKRSVWLEDSFGRQPLKYLHGFHNVVVGLEKALEGKREGDRVDITLGQDEAYGPRHPGSIFRVPKKRLRVSSNPEKLKVGMKVSIQTDRGYKEVIVAKVGKYTVDVDLNHPYAGWTLYYEIEVVAIRDASAEEIEHGHVHGEGGHQH